MADRQRRRVVKRLNSCKIRVKTKSTTGKKFSRAIPLIANKYSRLSDNFPGTNVNTEPDVFSSEDIDNLDTFDTTHKSAYPSLSKHHQRRIKENNSWNTIRQCLLKARLEEEAFDCDTERCVECQKNPACCRCLECGPSQYFCIDCAKSTHEYRNYFHQLEIFKDGCFVPLMMNHSVLSLPHQKNCSCAEGRVVMCIDQNGYQHKKIVLFCPCEEDAVTLVKLQLWPGSATRPLVAFHFKLLMMAEVLVLECHVSLKKFCDTLELNKSNMLPKWVKNVYKILSSDSFDEFRYHQYLFRTMRPYFPELTLDRKCPLCPDGKRDGTPLENVMIESMDGCFGLTRKKSAGANIIPPRHCDTFFASCSEVDSYVDDYARDAKEALTDCNEFKAGEVDNMLRSKGRNKLFDEKGMFGRVCRHEYPKGFISMKHGERIAYSMFEVERLLSSCTDRVDIKITYDISCTLSAHLKNNDKKDIMSKVELAIPVFHCYGHKSSCQIAFSPRRMTNFGLTDGEGIERLWAYLRGFASMTKEMTAGRRVDTLTDALLHYAQHRVNQFGASLLLKLRKAKELLENTTLQLDEIFSNLQVSYDANLVKLWSEEEKSLLLSRNRKKTLPVTWEAEYVQNLFYLQELGHSIAAQDAENHDAVNDLVRKRRRTLKTIESMERKHHVIRRWKVGDVKYNTAVRLLEEDRKNRVLESLYSLAVERMFLLTLKRKYADGQKIAIKLSRQITKKTNTLKVSVEKYNASVASWRDRIEGLPSFLTFDEVKDPESCLFQEFKSNDVEQNHVPFSVKRTVIDLHYLTERCKEEIELINIEIARLIKFHTERKATCQEIVEKHNADPALHMRGLSCVMQKRAYEEENKLYLLGQTLSGSAFEVLSSLPQHKYGFCNVIEHNSNDCEESCTESEDCDDSESGSECESDDDVYELGASDEDDDDILHA